MDKLQKCPKLIAWLYALIVNGLMLLVFANTCTIRFRTNDDWSIANFISGVRGKEFATPYISFVSILLTKPLYYLYQMYREINWFAVAEETVIFLSMSVLIYILTRKLLYHNGGILAFIFPVLFVGAFAATFYCRMQYTQTASVGSFSGFLLLLFSFKYDGCRMNMDKVTGIVLTGVSALFRLKCFLLILPFVLVLLFDYAVVPFMRSTIKCNQQCGKSLLSYILVFFTRYRKIILILSFLMAVYVGADYVQKVSFNGRYADYRVFNSARAHFIDYDQYDYEQIREELSELGVSKNDYELMQLWTFGDADFITTDLLNSIVELQPGHRGSLKEALISYVHGYKERIFIGIYFFTLSVLGLLILSGGGYKWVYSLTLFILLHMLDFYFCVIVGRYPYWLMIGVLFSAIGTSVYLVDLSGLCNMERRIQIILSIFLGVVLFPLGNEWYVENFNKFQYEYEGVLLYEYMNERKDDVFYIPTKNSGAPTLSKGYSIFRTTREGTSRNTVSLGGWSTGHPDIIDSYHELGIYSALQQIDKENVYLLSTREFVEPYQTYLYEHTGRTSTYSLTNEQFGTSIYKITSDMSGGTEQDIFIENISHEYNTGYDLYEIDMRVSVEESLAGREYDVYLAVEDMAVGDKNFFMCYDAEKTKFDGTKQPVILKALIPEEYIESGKKYQVSIVLTDENDNKYYTDNWEVIERVSDNADN